MNRRSLFGALVGVLLAPFTFGKDDRHRVEGVRIGRFTGAWGSIDATNIVTEEVPKGCQVPVELHIVDVQIVEKDAGVWWSVLGERGGSHLELLRKLSCKFPEKMWCFSSSRVSEKLVEGSPLRMCDIYLHGVLVYGFSRALAVDERRRVMVHLSFLDQEWKFPYRENSWHECFRFISGDGKIYSKSYREGDVCRLADV